MSLNLVSAPCPVCQHAVAAPFFDGGDHPLATLGWPSSELEARAMARHPQNYVQCPRCTHVWNRSFSYDAIPYRNNPNHMFNQGGIWKGHLASTRDLLLARLPPNPIVIDIGCGEGHFVRGLSAAASGKGRFVGFDPHIAGGQGGGVEFHARYFEPLSDMADFTPDAVIIRHVLEHLTEPAVLLEQLAWGAAGLGKGVWLLAEMPCIDRVFETGRLADFYYEHPSHFTTQSFRTLMKRAGEVIDLAHGYDGEVVYAFVHLDVPARMQQHAQSAAEFARRADDSRIEIRAQIDALAASGKAIAIWGGTGKAAAFIHQFGVDAQRFPLVVDSDPNKVGTFVPGTGQEIRSRDVLKSNPVDVIIIPTQWRARDILVEMAREGIRAGTILIEHDGQLMDREKSNHPYR